VGGRTATVRGAPLTGAGAVTAVDLQLGLGNTSTSGCEAADFAGFPEGNIALLQRGTCTFELKAENAAALYLNFDMVGSPNYVRFVYDGSGDVGPAGPAGSTAIEDLFNGFYAARGLAFEPTAFDGRSDYGPFIAEGVDIPAGGLFTGAEGIKTLAQRDVYGGIAGQQYDPCYHAACDTFSNNSNEVLDLNADAIAFATLTYAMDTSSVNGA